jgi:superfamily II DNA or RNA helicase
LATPVDKFIANHSSWQSFFVATTKLPDSAPRGAPDKGKVFERLTQLYLRTDATYRTKLAHVWRARDELPRNVRSRIGLPGPDEGIDLVAETVDGEFWAIQCKFRTDTSTPLTVRDLSTFTNLAYRVCRNITLAVVAHTCAKPVRKAQLLPGTTEIGLDTWLGLDDEAWRRIRTALSDKVGTPAQRRPRPHQRAAVAAAKKHFLRSKSARGRMIMPCGTGKSLTAFWIAQALRPRSIVVAVPSLALIKQSLGDWTKEFLAHGEIPDWLCVCGDESTGDLEQDAFVSQAYELGVDATTDRARITAFLRRSDGKRKIVFVTYQSGVVLAKAARDARFAFDLGIMDEAHRTVGPTSKAFAHLLSDKNIRIKRRLFMTATERVVRGADDDVLSMDDTKVYGDRFYLLSFKQAIDARPPIIADYKILTITVSDERVKRLIAQKRYLRTEQLGEREAQALAAGIALDRAFREKRVGHAISFHRSIRAAEDFREQHEQIVGRSKPSERPICLHVSSRKTTGERAELLTDFREQRKAMITNARCLQEGVDIPAVDCVLFADPKQSVVDIVQAAGRAMRPCKGKRFGYIVVPIVVPSGMKFDEFAETTEFKQVARVITALSTQDDRIAEEFRATSVGRRRRREQIVEIVGDVPIGEHIDFDEFRREVQLKLWKRVGRANWRPFKEARAFVRGLRLRRGADWLAYCKSDRRPADIPVKPRIAYRRSGWISMGDWLGTGWVANYNREYRPFAKARAFVRSLGLANQAKWFLFSRSGQLPDDVPANPYSVYRLTGWVSYGDWLGTGRVASQFRKYRSFAKARAYARDLHLRSWNDWVRHASTNGLPSDIPRNPYQTYRDGGWMGVGDWLGTGVVASRRRQYRDFASARGFARKLRLQSGAEWRTFCRSKRKPADIPSDPRRAYRSKGWRSMGDWLGTGTVAPSLRRYRPFRQARTFARNLHLASAMAWRDYCRSGRMPADIPANPDATYARSGWQSWGDWLGTGSTSTVLRKYRSYAEARRFARSLKLASAKAWQAWCIRGQRPADIPSNPDVVYRTKGWGHWGDWLGTGTIAPRLRRYRSFSAARTFARSLRLSSRAAWTAFCTSRRRPSDIPGGPGRVYRSQGWRGWGDWLGTGRNRPGLPRASRRTAGFGSRPRQPGRNTRPASAYRSFAQARAFVRRLHLPSVSAWNALCKSGKLPRDIPHRPDRAYRDRGWKDWIDWLGP